MTKTEDAVVLHKLCILSEGAKDVRDNKIE